MNAFSVFSILHNLFFEVTFTETQQEESNGRFGSHSHAAHNF